MTPEARSADRAAATGRPPADAPGIKFASVFLLAAAALVRLSPASAMPARERPGSGVTSVRSLSDYEPSLRMSPGDTRVYILDSGTPGGTLLVVGGTHADETAGTAAAMAIARGARPTAGRIIVVPRANNSAASGDGPGKRVGSRLTNPAHQGSPDPALYYPPGSASPLDGHESRNLDRAYPGKPDGTLTERVAFGLMELLRTERVDLAVDLHEAPPDSPLSMSIIAHERALGLAALAVLDLEDAGIAMSLEASPAAYPGLSHREWGDRTGALAFIVETANPAMGGYGHTRSAGHDKSVQQRVAIHLAVVAAIVDRFNEASDRRVAYGIEARRR